MGCFRRVERNFESLIIRLASRSGFLKRRLVFEVLLGGVRGVVTVANGRRVSGEESRSILVVAACTFLVGSDEEKEVSGGRGGGVEKAR